MTIASFAFSIAFVTVATNRSATEHTYLVAGETLDTAALHKSGTLVPARSGFYRFSARGADDYLRRLLRDAGAEFILDPTSDTFDPGSPTSTALNRSYRDALAKLYGLDGEHEGADFDDSVRDAIDRRKGPDGNIDFQAIRQAVEHRERMPKGYIGYVDPTKSPNAIVAPWVHLGPFGAHGPFRNGYGTGTISGRKEAIAVAKGDSNTIWTVSRGGVFKSIDKGQTWTNMSAGWKFSDANAIAIDPLDKNVVYVGTGDYADGGGFGSLPFGIMKTTDGGQSWTNYGDLTVFQVDETITDLLIAPWNHNTLFCTTRRGNRLSSGPGRLYRSTDAGVTWIDTGQPTAAYTDLANSIGFSYRLGTAYYIYAATDGGNIYRTQDGTTWTAVTKPVGTGYTHIACGKLSANVIYAITATGRIQRSADAGGTWSDFNSGGYPATGDGGSNWAQLGYNLFVGVTKIDASTEKVYVGTLTCATRTNTNATWTDLSRSYTPLSQAHCDHHAFANDPNNNNVVYIGNDGGIYRNLANSSDMVSLNSTIGDLQAYALDVHPSLPDFILSGNQDNSVMASRGNLSQWSGLDSWDGGYAVFDKVHPGTYYTSSQEGYPYKYTTDFQDNETNIDLFPTKGQRAGAAFICPMATVGNGSEILLGTGYILRYPGTGTSWISGFWTGSTVDVIATIGNNVIFGCRNGSLYRSADKGGTAVSIGQGLTGDPIGAIYMKSGTDVLVGLMGSTGGLYRTTDATAATPTWTSASGSGDTALPATPVNAIAVDPYNSARWYVGTDAGLFMTTDSGASWYACGTQGFPNVCVTGLKVAHNYLYASTAGLGVWRVKVAATVGRSISGFVTQYAAGLPNVKVRLNASGDIEGRLSNSVPQSIPDNDADGIQSNTYNFYENHTMTTCKVFVHISHTSRGDLQIDLKGPDGTIRRLKDTVVGDTGDDVVATYDVSGTFAGTSSLGLWQLQVRDLAAGGSGTLNTWSVIYTYEGSQTIAELSTDDTGYYRFTDMPAGIYTITPTRTGKVFVPSSRTVTLDGSLDATRLNFVALVPVSFTLGTKTIIGGGVFRGGVKLSTTPEQTAYVQIASNNPAVQPPSSVAMTTIGPSPFLIGTSEVTSPQIVSLSASYGGATKSTSIHVYPIPTLQSIDAAPSPIYGGKKVTGHVVLAAPAPAETTVKLSSDSSDLVPTTSTVTVHQGDSSAVFYANTKVVASPVSTHVTATLGTQTASATVDIEPPPVIVSWSFDPSSVTGGQTTVGTVVLARPVVMSPLRVFFGDNSDNLSMPTYVAIPVGGTTGRVRASTTAVTTTVRVQCDAWFLGPAGTTSTFVTINP